MNNSKRTVFMFCALSVLVIAALCVSLVWGSTGISLNNAVNALMGAGDDVSVNVMWKIRIPRVLAALLLGGSLSVSGYLLQTFFQNPIAGPYVLGVSSGAKLVVALVMISAAYLRLRIGSASLILAAFFGSLITLGLVLVIAKRARSMAILVVCGVMIGYICQAITEFTVTFASDSDIVNLHNWSRGSFSGMTMDNIGIIFFVTMLVLIASLMLSKPIGALRLGESYAKSAGVNIRFLRVGLILLSGLSSAVVTAFAGPVSFVGIAVPHLIRRTFKTSKPQVLIPACFFGGSVFCMICDTIARVALAPSELSISAVTAVFGAPVVIALMISKKRGDAV